MWTQMIDLVCEIRHWQNVRQNLAQAALVLVLEQLMGLLQTPVCCSVGEVWHHLDSAERLCYCADQIGTRL